MPWRTTIELHVYIWLVLIVLFAVEGVYPDCVKRHGGEDFALHIVYIGLMKQAYV